LADGVAIFSTSEAFQNLPFSLANWCFPENSASELIRCIPLKSGARLWVRMWASEFESRNGEKSAADSVEGREAQEAWPLW
jgi:hypothetical protein